MHPIWYLDEPDLTKDNIAPTVFKIKGWIAALEPVEDLVVFGQHGDAAPIMTLDLRQKHEIAESLQLGNLSVTGFHGECPFKDVEKWGFVAVRFACGGHAYEIIAPVHAGRGFSMEDKPLKLKRLIPYLICPYCEKDDLRHSGKFLKCSACERKFPFTDSNINFLSDELRAEFESGQNDHPSENEYDGVAFNYINRFKDGLILDCGAGLRKRYFGNVVNFEIVPYPSTDVLGSAESLPFKDNTFDAVFSFAVLEHVKNPFVCAEEMIRVLKPGGIIYCQAPFLQPFHAHPHHYYNMTQSGLWNLFSTHTDIHKLDVLNFGQPVFTLARLLLLYADGLPEHTRAKFMNMTVGDFLYQPVSSLLAEPFVTQLTARTQRELAFCNYLIAAKKR